MRNLAESGGMIWFLLAALPLASIINTMGKYLNLNVNTIVSIQLPFMIIQIFSLFMIIRYHKEIF